MDLPSAMYRTLKHKKSRPAPSALSAPFAERPRSRQRTRERTRERPPAQEQQQEQVEADDLATLSALKHFALHNKKPMQQQEQPIMPPLQPDRQVEALDVLLEVAEAAAVVPIQGPGPVPPQASELLETTARPPLVPPVYTPRRLEQMFGTSVVAAVRQVLEWYHKGHWKEYPCVLWGPCGVGKTLLCTLMAAKFNASFVTYEDELDVTDKVSGWLQSPSHKKTGVLAFSAAETSSTNPTWLLLDDVDSLEGQCRKDVLALLKKGKTYPGPVFLTCNDLFDKAMASLKALPLTLSLKPHSDENLARLVRTVNPATASHPGHVAQIAAMACGDARKAIIATQQGLHFTQMKLYHSPFEAVEALFKKPEIESRALDGQEFMVQTLLYQNYAAVIQDRNQNYSLPPEKLEREDLIRQVQDMEQLDRVANAWCEFDCLDKLHELPEYTKTYLTYSIPGLCALHTRSKRRAYTRLQLNPKFMYGSCTKKVAPSKMLI